jgi:microcystin-dependent protein
MAMPRATILRFVWIAALALLGVGAAAAPAEAQREVDLYIGQVEFLATDFCPGGWPAGDGQMLSISDYPAQFRVIGTTYGGDGVSNFALPKVAMATAGGGAMLKACVTIRGAYPPPPGNPPTAFLYLGQVEFMAENFCPAGWLPADGRLLRKDQYDTLFSMLGTTYGGDGKTNFALPKVAAMRTASGAMLTPCIEAAGAPPPRPPAKPDAYVFLYLSQVEFLTANFCPEGWLPADGRLLQLVQYRNLFSVMGTRYGGDGITTFALPKVAMRTDSGAMLTACVVVAGQVPQRPR